MRKLFLLILLALWITSCAGVDVTRLASDKDYKEGIRFYRSYPYVLISINKDTKALQAATVFLPKMNEEYVINVRSGLGTVNAEFTLTDGWNLTSFGDTRDSKIPETINALTGLLKEVATLEKKEGEIPALEPGLYRYEFDAKGFVSGLMPVLKFKQLK